MTKGQVHKEHVSEEWQDANQAMLECMKQMQKDMQAVKELLGKRSRKEKTLRSLHYADSIAAVTGICLLIRLL